MKKIATITTILFSVAFISSTAFAWWGGGMMGDHHGYHYTKANSADQKAFYDATEDLRATLAADQAELEAVRAADNPDTERINALTQKIVKDQDSLRAQAEKYHMAGTDNDDNYCPYSGYGHHGGGHMMNWN